MFYLLLEVIIQINMCINYSSILVCQQKCWHTKFNSNTSSGWPQSQEIEVKKEDFEKTSENLG